MASPAIHPPRRINALVAFGILAAPAAWALQGLLGWLVEAVGCGTEGGGVLSASTVRTAELALAGIALLIAATALAVSARLWRRSRDASLVALQVAGVADFAAATALLVSAAFFLAILWAGLPALLLTACESIR